MEKEHRRVLCIDDEEMIRLSIGDYLEDSGYDVLKAENGQVGLEMFRAKQPDIVLVDLRMPEIDGLEILAIIRREAPETPVIVVSGTGIIHDVIEALHLGAWDYITKPIEDMAILELAIEQCLEKARIIRENREYKEELEHLVQERTQALKHSETQLKLALESANEGMWDFNPQTGEAYYSPRWFTMLGYAPDAFPHTEETWFELVHPDDRPLVKKVNELHQRYGQNYEVEFRMKANNGEYRWIASRGKVVEWDEHGKPIRMIGTHTDVTRRKKIEEELRILNEELEQRVAKRTAELEALLETVTRTQKQLIQSEKLAALGGLVAGVAHEINTPIGVGVTAASHLQLKTRELVSLYQAGTMKRSELEQYLKVSEESSDMILANLYRAADLIRSFKQVAVDQSSEEKRQFKLKEYLHDILLSLGPKLRNTEYEVVVLCPDNLIITSYPGVFSQILTNFIMNSLLHGFEESGQGKMTIEVSVTHERLRLVYSDNGQGISEEHLPKIFNPFFTTRNVQKSSGLGMFVVYNLVTQKLQGTITCESQVGVGTTFVLDIPCSPTNNDGITE